MSVHHYSCLHSRQAKQKGYMKLTVAYRQLNPKLHSQRHPYHYRFSQLTGHYTQMLWWDTSRIGCGFTMFEEDGWWKKLYTCNYGPAGNIIFSQMYLRGAPCSSCPVGTSCSLEYPGLCGEYIQRRVTARTFASVLNMYTF